MQQHYAKWLQKRYMRYRELFNNIKPYFWTRTGHADKASDDLHVTLLFIIEGLFDNISREMSQSVIVSLEIIRAKTDTEPRLNFQSNSMPEKKH